MMIFSLVAMIGLEKCCIISACLQWLCHSGERTVARGPLVFFCYVNGYHLPLNNVIFQRSTPLLVFINKRWKFVDLGQTGWYLIYASRPVTIVLIVKCFKKVSTFHRLSITLR